MRLLLLTLLTVISFTVLEAVNVRLRWTPVFITSAGSITEDLIGYKLYFSPDSFFRDGVWISTATAEADITVQKIPLQESPETTISLPPSSIFYFRVTARDKFGGESRFNLDDKGDNVQVSTFTRALIEYRIQPAAPIDLQIIIKQ